MVSPADRAFFASFDSFNDLEHNDVCLIGRSILSVKNPGLVFFSAFVFFLQAFLYRDKQSIRNKKGEQVCQRVGRVQLPEWAAAGTSETRYHGVSTW